MDYKSLSFSACNSLAAHSVSPLNLRLLLLLLLGGPSRRRFRFSAFTPLEENSTAMAVVCPKPRRHGFSLDDHLRSLRHRASIGGASQAAESELLDIILAKENNGDPLAMGPSFLCGSPPSRAANPVVQDEQFHKEDADRHRLQPTSARKTGCVPAKFGHQPAIIRVEGFDSIDRRNCSVSALA